MFNVWCQRLCWTLLRICRAAPVKKLGLGKVWLKFLAGGQSVAQVRAKLGPLENSKLKPLDKSLANVLSNVYQNLCPYKNKKKN